MCSSLLAMSGAAGGGDGGSAEDAVAVVVKEVLKRLPPDFDIEAVQRKYPVLYEESMNTTIAQEMTRFNRLTSVVRQSMQELEKALAGLVVMSSDTENAFNLMAVNQVCESYLSPEI
jgi:dynein heavy chain